jgi:hypothetical protein
VFLAAQPTIEVTTMPHDRKLPTADDVARPRAVAYYRCSAEDRQEDAIPDQREQVHQWADDHDTEIVREYADGPSPPNDSQDE